MFDLSKTAAEISSVIKAVSIFITVFESPDPAARKVAIIAKVEGLLPPESGAIKALEDEGLSLLYDFVEAGLVKAGFPNA